MALKRPPPPIVTLRGRAGQGRGYLGIAWTADPAESPRAWYGHRHLTCRDPRGDCSRLLPNSHPWVQFLELKTC